MSFFRTCSQGELSQFAGLSQHIVPASQCYRERSLPYLGVQILKAWLTVINLTELAPESRISRCLLMGGPQARCELCGPGGYGQGALPFQRGVPREVIFGRGDASQVEKWSREHWVMFRNVYTRLRAQVGVFQRCLADVLSAPPAPLPPNTRLLLGLSFCSPLP